MLEGTSVPSRRKTSETGSRPIRVIVTVSGGGFFWQSRSVACGLGAGFEIHYVTPEDPDIWADRGLPDGVFHEISRITTMADRSFVRQALNSLSSFRDAFRVIRDVEPDAVICVASSIALPLCFWARLFRKKAIFVESITRVSRPSATGRLLSRLRLCDRLYVQWPEAEKLYRGAIYKGTVL